MKLFYSQVEIFFFSRLFVRIIRTFSVWIVKCFLRVLTLELTGQNKSTVFGHISLVNNKTFKNTSQKQSRPKALLDLHASG